MRNKVDASDFNAVTQQTPLLMSPRSSIDGEELDSANSSLQVSQHMPNEKEVMEMEAYQLAMQYNISSDDPTTHQVSSGSNDFKATIQF